MDEYPDEIRVDMCIKNIIYWRKEDGRETEMFRSCGK